MWYPYINWNFEYKQTFLLREVARFHPHNFQSYTHCKNPPCRKSARRCGVLGMVAQEVWRSDSFWSSCTAPRWNPHNYPVFRTRDRNFSQQFVGWKGNNCKQDGVMRCLIRPKPRLEFRTHCTAKTCRLRTPQAWLVLHNLFPSQNQSTRRIHCSKLPLSGMSQCISPASVREQEQADPQS